MIVVLGDLIADFNLRIPSFPVRAGDLTRAEYLELGPGGATNIAIVAARLGLDVMCLGEVGNDEFGKLVLDGLRLEEVDVSSVIVTPGGETPVAGVIVDAQAEPAYIGYRGRLEVRTFPEAWKGPIRSAEAVFADGWADHEDIPALLLEGFRAARQAGAPVFFDPGPGNPEFDRSWHSEAAALATVVLATESEAARLTGGIDAAESAQALLDAGPDLVVVKRGAAGCILRTRQAMYLAPGLPVEARDTTGAGDSLAAAVLFGYLHGLDLEPLGTLANAAGAAKVRKFGTGHNVPTREEIAAMLERFGEDPGVYYLKHAS